MAYSPKKLVSAVSHLVGKKGGTESAALLDGACRGWWAESSPEHLRLCPRSGLGPCCRGYGQALTEARLLRCWRPGGATPPPAPRPAAAASAARSVPPPPRSARVPAATNPPQSETRAVSQVLPPLASRGRPTGGAGTPQRVRQPRASAQPSAEVGSHSRIAGLPWAAQFPSADTNFLPYKAGRRWAPRLQSLPSPSLQSHPTRSPRKAPPPPPTIPVYLLTLSLMLPSSID